MKLSVRKGFGFGLTSGVITTLGLMVGLNSSTHSMIIVIGGILVIAIADALSDSLGIHISEESENIHSTREIWESTAATFLSKLVFSLTFIVPIILLPLDMAIAASIIWGLFLIALFSFRIARQNKIRPHKIVIEHVAISLVVIFATHFIGEAVSSFL
jgi:VIT1/CCC1 family predicted Fe2+/Mn2+ transporter